MTTRNLNKINFMRKDSSVKVKRCRCGRVIHSQNNSGLCCFCFNEKYHKNWSKNNKEYMTEYQKKWREEHPEYFKEYYKNHKEEIKC
jgi:hypothetical protein